MRAFSFDLGEIGKVTLKTNSDKPVNTFLENKSEEFVGVYTPLDGVEKTFKVVSPIRPVLYSLGFRDFDPKFWEGIKKKADLKSEITEIEEYLDGNSDLKVQKKYDKLPRDILLCELEKKKDKYAKLEEKEENEMKLNIEFNVLKSAHKESGLESVIRENREVEKPKVLKEEVCVVIPFEKPEISKTVKPLSTSKKMNYCKCKCQICEKTCILKGRFSEKEHKHTCHTHKHKVYGS
jgi:hypothetical protein